MKLSLPLYQVEDCARILHRTYVNVLETVDDHGEKIEMEENVEGFDTPNDRGDFIRQLEQLAEVLAPAIIRQHELTKNKSTSK